MGACVIVSYVMSNVLAMDKCHCMVDSTSGNELCVFGFMYGL